MYPSASHRKLTRLFELIRQDEVCKQTSRKIGDSDTHDVSQGDALMLKAMADASFRQQRLPGPNT